MAEQGGQGGQTFPQELVGELLLEPGSYMILTLSVSFTDPTGAGVWPLCGLVGPGRADV